MSLPQLTDNASSTNEQGATIPTHPKPLIMPDAFDGDACYWDDWISHFESVARVNTWDAPSKLLWLEVRLIGKARKAWNRLPEESKGSYPLAKAALRNRFEPESRKDLYAAEFQTRSKRRDETWGDLADNLRTFAERAFPDLNERAKEKLSVDRFLSLLDRPEVALAVRQKKPKLLDDAVAATLEIESILSLSSPRSVQIGKLSAAEDDQQPPPTVSAVQQQAQTSAMTELLQSLLTRMDQLEVSMTKLNKQPASQPKPRTENTPRIHYESAPRTNRGQITCYSCGGIGHYARGCAFRRQGN